MLGTLNQLRQAEHLIRYEGIEDNYLVVIAIPQSSPNTQIVLESADKKLFKHITTRLISPKANVFAWLQFHELKRGYQTVFREIKARNFFMFNFESHYTLAIYAAREAGCTLNLIEEGGTTYKMLPDRKLRTPFISIPHLPHKLFLFFFRLFPYYRKMQATTDYWDTFDRLYVAFPERLQGQMEAKEIVRFNMHAKSMLDTDTDKYSQQLVKKYNITSEDYIFLSSRYKFQPLLFCLAAISIFKQITRHGAGKLFVKLHPAEQPSTHKLFLERIAKANLPRVKLIGERDFLIEPVISIAKPKAVLGFATATFLYSPEISPKTRIFEVTAWFIKEIMAFPHASAADLVACETMRVQKEFYSHFPYIESIGSARDLAQALANQGTQNQPRESQDTPENPVSDRNVFIFDQSRFLMDARLALRRSLWRKALCNFDWAYPDGVKLMPLDVAEEYFRALMALERVVPSLHTARHILLHSSPLIGTASEPQEETLCSIFRLITLLRREGLLLESWELLHTLKLHVKNQSPLFAELQRQKVLNLAFGALWSRMRSELEKIPKDVISPADCLLYWLALAEPWRSAAAFVFGEEENFFEKIMDSTSVETFFSDEAPNESKEDAASLNENFDTAEDESLYFVGIADKSQTNFSVLEGALYADEKEAHSPTKSGELSGFGQSLEPIDLEAKSLFLQTAYVVLPELFLDDSPEKNYTFLLQFQNKIEIRAEPCLSLPLYIALAHLAVQAKRFEQAEGWLEACSGQQKASPLWQRATRAYLEEKRIHMLQVYLDKSESEEFGYAFSEGAKAFRLYGKSLYWLISSLEAADIITIQVTEIRPGEDVLRGTISAANLKDLFKAQKILFVRYRPEEKACVWCYASQLALVDFSGYEEWRNSLATRRRTKAKPLRLGSRRMKKGV